ncbi:hypothetical protein GCM10027079_31100 [Sediminivirga luteola]
MDTTAPRRGPGAGAFSGIAGSDGRRGGASQNDGSPARSDACGLSGRADTMTAGTVSPTT